MIGTSSFESILFSQSQLKIFEKASSGLSSSGVEFIHDNYNPNKIQDYLTHFLPDPLNTFALKSLTITSQVLPQQAEDDETTNNTLLADDASNRVDELEISIRTHYLTLVSNLMNALQIHDLALIGEALEDLLFYLRSVIDLTLHIVFFANYNNVGVNVDESLSEIRSSNFNYRFMDSSQLKKLPFLLLEDLVDTLPIPIIQQIWNIGPSIWIQSLLCSSSPSSSTTTNTTLTPKATIDPEKLNLFNQGAKYCLIRLCNKLLKNLSIHSQDEAAQFAGQISMTLASVFPLSERSAVNVLGAFHTDNIVTFESYDEWHTQQQSFNNQKTDNEEDKSDANNNATSQLDYNLYRIFWEIQQTFTDPQKLLPKVVEQKRKGVQLDAAANAWANHMNNFVKSINTVLEAFEGHPFSRDMVKHLKSRWKNTQKFPDGNQDLHRDVSTQDSNGGIVIKESNVTPPTSSTVTSKRHYKYLTNSQLLHLQLRDPEIRMQVLTQVLIISSYFTSSLSAFMYTPTGSSASNKSTCSVIMNNLEQVEKRSMELLQNTPPNGQSHFKTLCWILNERESIWKQWKKAKCTPPIEKYLSLESSSQVNKDQKVAVNGHHNHQLSSSIESTYKAKADCYSYTIDVRNELPSIALGLSQTYQPNLYEYLEEYVEALDPDAGIEEEYHPKNDKIFSWRAMRLLSNKYVGELGDSGGCSMIDKRNGNFEGIVRKIWREEKGIDIPGSIPESANLSDDEVSAHVEGGVDGNFEGEDAIVEEEDENIVSKDDEIAEVEENGEQMNSTGDDQDVTIEDKADEVIDNKDVDDNDIENNNECDSHNVNSETSEKPLAPEGEKSNPQELRLEEKDIEISDIQNQNDAIQGKKRKRSYDENDTKEVISNENMVVSSSIVEDKLENEVKNEPNKTSTHEKSIDSSKSVDKGKGFKDHRDSKDVDASRMGNHTETSARRDGAQNHSDNRDRREYQGRYEHMANPDEWNNRQRRNTTSPLPLPPPPPTNAGRRDMPNPSLRHRGPPVPHDSRPHNDNRGPPNPHDSRPHADNRGNRRDWRPDHGGSRDRDRFPDRRATGGGFNGRR